MSLSSLSIVELGLGAFLATNLDNGLVFSAQLALAPEGRTRSIRRGQFTASMAVFAFCFALRHVLVGLPLWSFSFLAVVPAVLSVRGFLQLRQEPGAPPAVRGFVGALLVTFAISADNAATYLPLLRATKGATEWLLLSVWTGSLLLLLAGVTLISRSPTVRKAAAKAGRFIEPPLYAALAILILIATGIL